MLLELRIGAVLFAVRPLRRVRLQEGGGRLPKRVGPPPFPVLHPRSCERSFGNVEKLPPPFRNRTPLRHRRRVRVGLLPKSA